MEAARVTPNLCVDGVDAAIAFYQHIFGVRERIRFRRSDLPAVRDDSFTVLGKEIGGTAVILNIDVDDVDGVLDRASAAGAISLRRMDDERHGTRAGQFEDPFGHRWRIAACSRDVPVIGALPASSVKGAAAPPPP
ncbi:MAG: VOC family protein [Acidimicrobiia bacterium]